MTRLGVRRLARQRKIKRQNRVYHRKVSKRKHYGVQTRIDKYAEMMRRSVRLDPVLQRLQELEENIGVVEELLRLVQVNSGFTADEERQVQDLLRESFERGSKRVFNLQGDAIRPSDPPSDIAIASLFDDQRGYLSKIVNDVGDVVVSEVGKALSGEQSVFDAQRAIEKRGRNVSRYRAERIARSEMIKASAKGTQQSFVELGVDSVVWLATEDSRTCQTCLDLHMSEWSTKRAPLPVQDSHPNCRCTLVADI